MAKNWCVRVLRKMLGSVVSRNDREDESKLIRGYPIYGENYSKRA